MMIAEKAEVELDVDRMVREIRSFLCSRKRVSAAATGTFSFIQVRYVSMSLSDALGSVWVTLLYALRELSYLVRFGTTADFRHRILTVLLGLLY